jgi:hypothetical protein
MTPSLPTVLSLRALLQPPSRGLSVPLAEQVVPTFLQDGVLDGQFHMPHSDQAFEPTLDVTTFEEATSSRRSTSRAVHHVDPPAGRIPELLALLNIAAALMVKFVFESHLVLSLRGCGRVRFKWSISSVVMPHLPFLR